MPTAGLVLKDGLKLVRLLGRGSHSVVYFAVTTHGQPRAVKIFPRYFQEFMEREYANAYGLNHPHLATILSRTEIKNQPALIVHFVKGVTFFERFDQRPALQHHRQAFLLCLTHLFEGLAYLHGQGIVHRDVKPNNIIVDHYGQTTLIDFDLSGPILENMEFPTQVGTQAFLSPEGERGESLGPESDLCSVGILLGWGIFGQIIRPSDTEESNACIPQHHPFFPLWKALTHKDRTRRLNDANQAHQELLQVAQQL